MDTTQLAGTPPPDLPTPPERRRRRPWRTVGTLLLALFALVLVLGVALVAAGGWALTSERGSAWLLARLPGVTVEAPQGRLLGDFAAQRLTLRLPGGDDRVVLDGLAWRGLRVARAPGPAWVRVTLDALEARRAELVLVPGPDTSGEPREAPTTLRLPIELDLRALQVGEIHAAALGGQPIRDLRAHLQLGANNGAEHRIDRLALRWDRLEATGHARVASTAPLALDAALALAQPAAAALPAWTAQATLAGPLAAPALQATLRASPSPQRPAQTLDARAVLRPFAAWPLAELQASANALDLSAFASAAPATALSGDAHATSTAADLPANVSLSLTNALAGRWDEQRLPLTRLTVALAARPDRPSELTLQRFDAELGTATVNAGRVAGSGAWSPERWNFDATVNALQPSRLDARAPAMQLAGPLSVHGGPTSATPINVSATLVGAFTQRGPARQVQLVLAGAWQPQRIELRELQARAGGTRASVSGLLAQTAPDAPWTAQAQIELLDFDPALWWPGRDDASWRRARHRLNGEAAIDLALPASGLAQPLAEALAALRGDASWSLTPSVLAGVPLSGSGVLHRAAGAPAQLKLAIDADGNTVRAEGRIATSGNGAGDAWTLNVDAGALDRLAPVFRLFQGSGGDATLAGKLTATARVNGRWPAMTTDGRLDAEALRIGTFALQTAQAEWTLGSSATAPLEARATLTEASRSGTGAPGPSIDSVRLELRGTGRAHTLALRAESKARAPAWADAVQAAPASGGTRTLALLQAQGGVIDVGGALAGWRGTLQQLDVRSNAAGAAPLLHTEGVALEAQWAGGPARASAQPGRATLLGGALRWNRIAWQAANGPGGFAQLDAEAELEPMRIAPLLARAQPDFGWGGDLTVAGRLTVRSAPTFHADIVIERRAGDLSVTDELGTRTLGLTDLRLGLVADNGTWSFTQGLAGKTLGVVAGAVVVRTAPQATWPSADAPLQGVLELRVDDLGTWGNWVPPGWRLGGALHSSASFGGRFGAPEYTGEIDGTKLSVRNFLQGVNVSDGDVAIQLRGSSAHIERFSAKAGGGSLTLAGDASLGEAPKALLTLNADKFQVLGRIDRRLVASGSGRLALDAKRLAFDGRFELDEGLIDFTRSDAPALAGDVEVVRARGVASPAAAASAAASPTTVSATAPLPLPAATPNREVALDLRVDLGKKLRVRGRGLDTGLRGELHLTSPGNQLAVNGTVRAEDGTYAAYGQKLAIDRGLVAFSGAVENPRLDIEATRPNLDIRVGVAVTGSATNPRVRLFSEPEMSEIDKLSWLVMGRASDSLGRTDTALLQRAALALLAGEGGGPTDQITKALGLDDISVRQTENGDVRDTVVALGKQLSRRWYVGYERGLNATTGSFQLIYRVAQRITVRAQSGDDNSLDAIWTWRWH